MASLDPFEGLLGQRLAKHLLRRATFNINKARIAQYETYTVDEALTELLAIPAKHLSQPIHYVNGGLTSPSPWINNDPNPDYGNVNEDNGSGSQRKNDFLTAWWLDEARRDTSLRSKMTYFLFTNLTAPQKDNGDSAYYYDYLSLLDHFCLSDWKELVFQVSINPRMLGFLNNDENTVQNPNENYARELLELYTIGVGKPIYIDEYGNVAYEGDSLNYSEGVDIPALARILTGWRFEKNNRDGMPTNGTENGNLPTGYAVPEDHDFTAKQLSSYFGNYTIPEWDTSEKTSTEKEEQMEIELRGLIDVILAQPETAKYVCRKLYRFFVSRTITTEIENDIIAPLAITFRESYNLEAVITQLLKSKHFFDADDSNSTDEIIGGLIKSPIELALHSMTITNFPVPDPIAEGESHYKKFYQLYVINNFLLLSAQPPFGASTTPPAGFPAHYSGPNYDRNWFNAATIITRYNICSKVLYKGIFEFDVIGFVKNTVSDPSDPDLMLTELTDIIFPETASAERKQYFIDTFLFDGGSLLQEGPDAYYYWKTLWSEYLGGNKVNTVKTILKSLLEALLWSQEYQTT